MKRELKELHYLGIVSAICKEIGLVKEIDMLTNSDPQRKVSVGQGALALILNGMGLTMSKPIYLVPNFFRTKPTELLIGPGIKPDDLNDDSLGRALDAIAENGLDTIFSHIALKAVDIYKIETTNLNGDITNVQVQGDYDNGGDLITFGFPKHGRPDLKQFLLSMITTFDGTIPLFIKVLRGNTSEVKHFKDLIMLLQESIKGHEGDHYFTLDSAVYSDENLKTLDKLLIVTRVPERIKEAKELKEYYASSLERLQGDRDYKFAEVCSLYGGVKQRWIVVYSRAAHEREKETLKALVQKEKIALEKELARFGKQAFSCESDAKTAVNKFAKQYKFHEINITKIINKEQYVHAGRPSSKTAKEITYMVETEIVELSKLIEKKIILGSIFILATTQLNAEKLPMNAVLSKYKTQSPLEGRFNLLKNSACIASKFYVKNEERITALAMIMCLSILIYALAERQLRKMLKELNKTVPDQKGKPIKNPTMRWVFSMFEGVLLEATIVGNSITYKVENLTDNLIRILNYLGKECMNMYCVIPTG